MLTALRFLELLALGLWLGALVFFSFMVAPAAFAVLPSRQLAGDLVGHLLPRLHLLGYLCGTVYLVALGVEQRLTQGSLRAVALPMLLVAAILVMTAVSQFGLEPRLAGLRAEMTAAFGAIDQVPRDHPLRVSFGRFHQVSALLLTANLLLVLVVLGLTVRRLR